MARTGRATLRSGWAGLVARHGWRAWAVPVLAVLTVLALVRGVPAHHPSVAAAGPATRVEGGDAGVAGFRAGATPAPVVLDLKSDDVTSCARNTHPRLILVSISRQHLWACRRGLQVDDTAVTTGNVTHHDQTPLGSWRVQDKQRDRYLVGPGYRDYVHYWVPFDGDFGLHDATWQTMPFGSAQWRTRGSHGCVHLPTATMAWIYRWATVGGTVVTVER